LQVSGQAVPEYRRAADVIKSRIEPGDIGSLITIPEIRKLADVKYATARRSADFLASEGVLRPHQGKGYEVIAVPEKAAADRASAKELGPRLARTEDQLQALEFNLEALYGKLGIPYPGDGASEREDSESAARRGRTG
jgi:DNA-binding GntR family transcriptional regulator